MDEILQEDDLARLGGKISELIMDEGRPNAHFALASALGRLSSERKGLLELAFEVVKHFHDLALAQGVNQESA